MDQVVVIEDLLDTFSEIRYVAIYYQERLVCQQRSQISDSSSGETDKFEELLVNPTLLTLARQRGNIDCGGLQFLIVGYGNFYQLIKEIKGGHISICLQNEANLNEIPNKILTHLENQHPQLAS